MEATFALLGVAEPDLILQAFLSSTAERYVEAAKLVDRATLYDAADAIALVKKAAAAKFDETVQVCSACDHAHGSLKAGSIQIRHLKFRNLLK